MSRNHCRAPEDGYYSLTFCAREDGDKFYGVIQRISASDPNDVTSLCQTAGGDYAYQSGSCSVSIKLWKISNENICTYISILSQSSQLLRLKTALFKSTIYNPIDHESRVRKIHFVWQTSSLSPDILNSHMTFHPKMSLEYQISRIPFHWWSIHWIMSLIYTRWTKCPAKSSLSAGHFQNSLDMSDESSKLAYSDESHVSAFYKLGKLATPAI